MWKYNLAALVFLCVVVAGLVAFQYALYQDCRTHGKAMYQCVMMLQTASNGRGLVTLQ